MTQRNKSWSEGRRADMVMGEALRWWRMRREPWMKLSDHLRKPTVGCVGAEEHGLALAVAQYIAYKRLKANDERVEW